MRSCGVPRELLAVRYTLLNGGSMEAADLHLRRWIGGGEWVNFTDGRVCCEDTVRRTAPVDDEALTVVRGYPDRDQADDFAEELQRSGILTTVIGPDVLDEGWGVAVPATEALQAGLIAAGLPRY